MPRVRPLEVKALVPLLQQDWGSPEELAEQLILTLDAHRTDRTDYVGVIRIDGAAPQPVWLGMGLYPGRDSARKDVEAALSAVPGSAYVITPVYSPARMRDLLGSLDNPPKAVGDWAEVKRDAENFRSRRKNDDYLGR